MRLSWLGGGWWGGGGWGSSGHLSKDKKEEQVEGCRQRVRGREPRMKAWLWEILAV